MTESSLDDLARIFGKLYDTALRETRLCAKKDCKGRHGDGSCACVDATRDVVDMIWEAKAGRPERLDTFVAEAMTRKG